MDEFWTNPRYCTLPAFGTDHIPASNKAGPSDICQNAYGEMGWDSGVMTQPIWTIPGNGVLQNIGTAYIYVTYNRRLYVTMTFNCNFLLSTDPVGTTRTIEVALWNGVNVQPQ